LTEENLEAVVNRANLRLPLRDPARARVHFRLEEKLSAIHGEICRAYSCRNSHSAIVQLAHDGQRVVEKLLALDCEDAALMRDYLRDAYEEIEDVQGNPQPAINKSPQNLILIAEKVQKTAASYCEGCEMPEDRVIMGPVKTLARLLEKSPPEKVFDLNRATIICDTVEQFAILKHAIQRKFGRIRKLKNKFKNAVEWRIVSEPPCIFYQLEFTHPDFEADLQHTRC